MADLQRLLPLAAESCTHGVGHIAIIHANRRQFGLATAIGGAADAADLQTDFANANDYCYRRPVGGTNPNPKVKDEGLVRDSRWHRTVEFSEGLSFKKRQGS